ncbi:hypothetical protein [Cryptosporangium sp. NPDC048952]|uniref:hypothetical protein n=1 Tax=Cryptosporangium sp. NPDC048952 TaxID=3363961 RepID=UPI00371C5047
MRRTKRSLGATGVLALGLAVVAAVCCLWSWMAYTYLFGRAVSVSIGDECLGKYQSGVDGTIECWDASWPLDGGEHFGSLVDYRQSGGAFEYDVIEARAFGDSARTEPSALPYVAGLVGPALFVVAGGVFVVGRRGARRKEIQYY